MRQVFTIVFIYFQIHKVEFRNITMFFIRKVINSLRELNIKFGSNLTDYV
jgi:hypothetical protein